MTARETSIDRSLGFYPFGSPGAQTKVFFVHALLCDVSGPLCRIW